MTMTARLPVVVAITGASGAPYAVRLLQALVAAQVPTWLIVSSHGWRLLDTESGIADLTALRVHVGNLPCEHGGVVALQADPAAPGFFNLRARNVNYRVSPEETTTGAIRLEDKAAGVVWLQLANKSMLMNQKLGQRLNDGCLSPSQELVAQAMLKAPPASVLDAKPVVAIEGATK